MKLTLSLALVLGMLATLALSIPVKEGKCNSDNCKLPNCRCWDDKHTPGNIDPFRTPQMIMLTFDFAFNVNTVKAYLEIFESLVNPNGCPAKGTFFVQALNSDAETLAMLHKSKHELAINSANGIIPTSTKEWVESVEAVTHLMKEAKVPLDKVKGIRAPNLFAGGNHEFEAMQQLNLTYDASCVNVDHSQPTELMWPYTLDHVEGVPKCGIGKSVDQAFPGLWEFPIPVLDHGGLACPVPSGCIPEINGTDDVFKLFYNSFDDHYFNGRKPFVIDIDPQWVTNEDRVTGTKEFLELIAAYEDTWILTMSQGMEWIRNPGETRGGANYQPWSC